MFGFCHFNGIFVNIQANLRKLVGKLPGKQLEIYMDLQDVQDKVKKYPADLQAHERAFLAYDWRGDREKLHLCQILHRLVF